MPMNHHSLSVALGRWAVGCRESFRGVCEFLGETFSEGLAMVLHPRRFRFGDAARAFERACCNGLPITTLIGFLLGIVAAAIAAIALHFLCGKGGKYPVPLIPFLSLGAVIAVLWGEPILSALF